MLVLKNLPMKNVFDSYRRNFCGEVEGNREMASADHVLRFWNINKKSLFEMMGNKYILTKEVSFDKPFNELRQEMEGLIDTCRDFYEEWGEMTRTICHEYWSSCDYYDYSDNSEAANRWREERNRYSLLSNMISDRTLAENRIGTSGKINITHRETGEVTTISISYNEKAMRAIGKVVKAYGIDEEMMERFRVAHASVLNQKRLSGELCLSIHPLDFATASDNANNWSSCMSWREGGCYRLGTVEMMNSPMVICAYLKSDKNEMDWFDHHDAMRYKWPSKKWRAWILVNRDVILCNRQYPYDNDYLATAAVDWVKEMMEKVGWSYGPTSYQPHGQEYYTNFMYNDIQDEQICCLSEDADCDEINFSGEAVCMWCGEQIDYEGNSEEADTLLCGACEGRTYCDCCGEDISHDDYYTDDATGEHLCEHCWYERYQYCEECSQYVDKSEVYNLEILENPVLEAALIKPLVDNPDREDVRHAYSTWRDWSENNSAEFLVDVLPHTCDIEMPICANCLEKQYGIDVYAEESPMFSGRTLNYARWRGLDYPAVRTNILDGTLLTFEQWCKITDRRDGTGRRRWLFPEQEAIYHTLYENFKSRCALAKVRDSREPETREEKYGSHMGLIRSFTADTRDYYDLARAALSW